MKLTNSKLRQLIKEAFETEEEFLEAVPAGEEQDEYGRSGSEAADTVETLNTMIENIQELAERFALGNADMELDTQDDARDELENAVRHLEDAKRTIEEVLDKEEDEREEEYEALPRPTGASHERMKRIARGEEEGY